MDRTDPIPLKRDVEAAEIPSGTRRLLPSGTLVTTTQVLGGSFTVQTDAGVLARIEGKDADALGLEPPASPAQPSATAEMPIDERVWEQLRTCYDPEIPVNIVDLGLIHKCEVVPVPGGGNRVHVAMMLTAPGCGMADILARDIRHKLMALPGVSDAEVELVLDPPWDPSRMSEAARLQLGL